MMQKYKLIDKIADTLYGDIVIGMDSTLSKKRAIKRICVEHAIRKTSVRSELNIQENAFTEMMVHRALKKSNLLKQNVLYMEEEYLWKGKMHLVMDYCEKGDLYEKVIQHGPFSTKVALKYFWQICRGVATLHRHGYAHRDVSLENIMIGDDGECRLMDFGLACDVKDKINGAGKLFYMAPEVYCGERYAPLKVDMWSLGVVLFMLVTGYPPYEVPCDKDERFVILKKCGIRSLLRKNEGTKVDESVMVLLEKLLVMENRPSVDDLMSSRRRKTSQESVLVHVQRVFRRASFSVNSTSSSLHGMKRSWKQY